MLFGNVLNELDEPEAVVRRYLDYLADDGSLVALAPADRNASVGLRDVERSVTDRATVYSPTLRLWPGEEPSDRCWSFDVKPDLTVPAFQRRLDEGKRRRDDGAQKRDDGRRGQNDEGSDGTEASRERRERDGEGDDGPRKGKRAEEPESDREPGDGEFVNVDVQYSHVVLRADGTRRREFVADASRWAKMAEMERHVTERVDCVAVKLSHSLSGEDANPLFRVGDGSEKTSQFAVLANETSLNRALREADYGDLLAFERTLVLWNDDEAAYNLVVDEKTVVDRL